MNVDPFRVQFLTIALDSQTVLTFVGLVVAGLIFRLAARNQGLSLGAGAWWDLVTASVLCGRALWVATHLDYYLRGPLQVFVIIDGGLSPLGLVFGLAYATWRLHRRLGSGGWRILVEPIAIAVLVTILFERAGCALTACGGGPPTDAPWALERGDELRQPIALIQVAMLAAALLVATHLRYLDGRAFLVAWTALSIQEAISLWSGWGLEGLLALAAALALYAGLAFRQGSQDAFLARSEPQG